MAANAAVLNAEADSLDWQRVTSASGNVRRAARSEFGRMYVEFRKGSRYVYHAVPRGVFDGLVSAPSAGKYLHAVVFPNYSHDRLI
jgi:hypothetical protein